MFHPHLYLPFMPWRANNGPLTRNVMPSNLTLMPECLVLKEAEGFEASPFLAHKKLNFQMPST